MHASDHLKTGAQRSSSIPASEAMDILSHQLRTACTAIMGYAELISTHRRKLTDTKIDEALAIIRRRASDMAALADDLNELAQLDETGAKLHLVSKELGEVVNPSIVRARIAHPALTFRFARPIEPLPVLVDDRRMQTVIASLLDRAAQGAPNGSEILTQLALREDSAVMSVCDPGPPVDSQISESLFDRFSVASITQAGTGLALYLTRVIVEAHGGTVHAERAEGSTVFVLTLPLDPGIALYRESHET